MTTGRRHLMTRRGFLYPIPAIPAPDLAIPKPAPKLAKMIDKETPAKPGKASMPEELPIIFFNYF
jgi:hypothetical protein